ncbi:MAG: hypothetical protein JW864_11725 [Spirochaetes bacterium]|nr:hypothetical protein [Spirochaetota bacterium]
MEVGTITNNITTPKINLNNIEPGYDVSNPLIAADISNSVTGTSAQFDYNEAMMDLQEVQDFLFMLIGEKSPGRDGKGEKLNIFA